MQLLVNDTIDTGSGDKINVRTGSFMGKAGHRHEAFLRRRLDNATNNNHEAAAPKVLAESAEVIPTEACEDLRPAEELDRILQALYSDIDMLDEMMEAAGKCPKMPGESGAFVVRWRILKVGALVLSPGYVYEKFCAQK